MRSNSLSQIEHGTQPQSAGKAHNVSFSSPVCDFTGMDSVGIDNRVFSESTESALSITQSSDQKKRIQIQLSQPISPAELPFQYELLTQRESLSQSVLTTSSRSNDVSFSQETRSSVASSSSGGEHTKKRKAKKVHAEVPKKIARKTLHARSLSSSSSSGSSSSSSGSSSSGSGSSGSDDDSDKEAVVDTMQQLASRIKAPVVHFTMHEVTRLKSLVWKYTANREDGTAAISWEGIGVELGKSAHDCYTKYQEIKPKDEEGAVSNTQVSTASSVSRATSSSSDSSNSGSSSGSNSSGSTASSKSKKVDSAPATGKNGDTTAIASGATASTVPRAPATSPSIAKRTASTASAASNGSATKSKKHNVESATVPSKKLSKSDTESLSIQSYSEPPVDIKPDNRISKSASAPAASGSAHHRKAEAEAKRKKSKYNDNKTKDHVTIRTFKEKTEKAFLEHVAYIAAAEEAKVKSEQEVRGLEFVILVFIDGKCYIFEYVIDLMTVQ